jgi:very-short-patch-repair endonuclease
LRETYTNVRKARELRRQLSLPEGLLWTRLRSRGSDRPVFRRQHPIGPYILDFYCAKAKLAIEIDGRSHDMGERPEQDVRRDEWLRERQIEVIRIPASDVLGQLDDTVEAIVSTAQARCGGHTPSTALRAVPLPRSAGEE